MSRKGKTFNEIFGIEKADEIKKKMSTGLIGKTKGRKQGINEIEKRRKLNTGKKRTDETKEKTRNSLLNIKHTETRKKNISVAHKGKDFSKNFGEPKKGSLSPNWKHITEEEQNQILHMHKILGWGSRKIEKAFNKKFSYLKILKFLRATDNYIPPKYIKNIK